MPGSFNQASLLLALTDNAPEDAAGYLREGLAAPGRQLQITEQSDGPPAGGVEISVAGPNYEDITAVSDELMSSLENLEAW